MEDDSRLEWSLSSATIIVSRISDATDRLNLRVQEPILGEQGDSLAGTLKARFCMVNTREWSRFGIEGADLQSSRDNRWLALWMVLLVAAALGNPAFAAVATDCVCCGPATPPCDDAIGDCCLIASIGEASRYAVLPNLAPLAIESANPGVLSAGMLDAAPRPRLAALGTPVPEQISPPAPIHLLHSVFLH
jgi:hypothetical protein